MLSPLCFYGLSNPFIKLIPSFSQPLVGWVLRTVLGTFNLHWTSRILLVSGRGLIIRPKFGPRFRFASFKLGLRLPLCTSLNPINPPQVRRPLSARTVCMQPVSGSNFHSSRGCFFAFPQPVPGSNSIGRQRSHLRLGDVPPINSTRITRVRALLVWQRLVPNLI